MIARIVLITRLDRKMVISLLGRSFSRITELVIVP